MGDSETQEPGAPWLIFSVFWALVCVGSVFSSVSSPLLFVHSIFNALSLLALWGYLRQVAVGAKVFWAFYFVMSLCLSAIAIVAHMVWAEGPAPYIILAIALVVVIPLYVAMFRYTFRSQHIWQRTDA